MQDRHFSFKFPDRRIARPPDRIERDAGPRLTAMAFDLKPSVSAIEALGEAVALVGKAGVDRHAYVDFLASTIFPAPVYKTYGDLIAGDQFEPARFAAPLGFKDIRFTLAAAESLRVPMPLGSLLHDRFLRLLAQGGEHLDWAAIGGLAAQDAGALQARKS